MNLVNILVRDCNCLWMSRPVFKAKPDGNRSYMFDTQRAGSAFGIPDLYEGGGRAQLNGHWIEAVIWAPHHICIHKKLPSIDAISFEFSGCVMAVFCWRNTWYSAHIQMGAYDRTLDWINFIRRERSDLTALGMFRPDYDLIDSIPNKFQEPNSANNMVQLYANKANLWGIITADGRFVSLCVYPLNDRFKQFKVLSVKEHYLSMNPQYYNSLFGSFRTLEAAKQCWNTFWDTRPGRMLYDYFQ